MQVNNRTLVEIAQRNPTAEAFFEYTTRRERNVRDGVSKLSAVKAQMIKAGYNPVPQELLSMFRELEKAGVGDLQGDMFRWRQSIKAIGNAIKPIEVPRSSSIPKSTKRLVICFDTGRDIELSFSSGMTYDEAKFAMEKLLQECK